jgi:2-methylcitrate dehydratase PrpD
VRAHGGQGADVDLRSEFSEVEIILTNGTVLRRRVDEPRGFPASPPTEKELEAKFLECAAAAMAETSAAELLSLLTDPAAVPVRRVVSALTSSEALSR